MDWRAGQNVPVDVAPESEYEYLGSYVTGIPDAQYPWHWDDVRMIRRLYDPEFVPLFKKVVYRARTGAILAYMHHGVGRYDPLRIPDPRLESCLMPYGVPWRKPNVVDLWFEKADKSGFAARHGLPAPFVPWGEWVVRMAEEAQTLSAKEMRLAAQKNWDSRPEAKALKQAKEESAYKQREEAPRQIEALNSMTSSDFKELQARVQGYMPPPETRPFVHLATG
jgi:hypothetical protein